MKLLAFAFAAGLLAGAALPALAQEKVTVAGIDATRVVIAPARSDLARIVRAGLAGDLAAAPREGRVRNAAQKLYWFYGARAFEPLWLVESASGTPGFSPGAQKILDAFKNAELEGLRPTDYLTDALDLAAAGTDPDRLAALETAFSEAALRYANDLASGRIDPREVSTNFDAAPKKFDDAEMLVRLASSETPETIFADLNPSHPEFVRLKQALGGFYDGLVEDQITIPDGKLLKPGMRDDRVTLLRQRLNVAAPEIPETAGAEAAEDVTYDEALVAAVMEFQTDLGLNGDGVVGPATLAALNGGTSASREDILANMERWRWMSADLGSFNVFVNIPEFRLWVKKDGIEQYTTRVVVGTVKNQTPIFSDEIEHIVVNPYWNVPSSIANNEIAPKLAVNPGYLASQNMELMYNSKVVSVSQVNWSAVEPGAFPFRIRQKPGAGNALGQVKFLFPNSHDVYLHDTPSKALFSRSMRAFSHGCVRVQNPMEFADALLAEEPTLSRASLEGQFGPTERWNNLDVHVPVHIAYFTLRVGDDGKIRAYGDVYGHNRKLIELMAK